MDIKRERESLIVVLDKMKFVYEWKLSSAQIDEVLSLVNSLLKNQ
ncbi:hypothetical protein [Gallibacterium anatis]|nr:hypothetical protein [Gallibacterium anatis]